MKKFILFSCFISLVSFAQAQMVLNYYDGTPALEKKHTDVEGTELLFADWVQGQVLMKDGKIYKGQKLKYNQLEDKFYFQSPDGVTMMFTSPAKEFVLGDSAQGNAKVFRNGFPSYSKFTPETYFEILADGKTVLMKKVVKNISEIKEYNSAVTKKHISDVVHYYLFNGKELVPVKKEKKDFLDAVKEKTAGIENYFSSKKPNLKKEEELVKLVQYINTL